MLDHQEKNIPFPQNFDIKVIVSAEVTIDESKANISRVFSECNVINSFVNIRTSGKGNYISYCYNIDIESHEKMNSVYEALKQVPKIKFAL